MPLAVRFYTDPACPASWAAEPLLRRLLVEFGTDLEITYAMGGLARDYTQEGGDPLAHVTGWLDHAERSGMPLDPRLWTESPIRSTYPACMAVKAAAEQGPEAEARYLRALREGLMCFRRKLDAKEALVEEARGAGLDAARFRIDLESNAIVEAFGYDLEERRAAPVEMPALRFGDDRWVPATAPYEEWVAGLERADGPRPDPLAALRRFGRMATAEVEAVCDLPGPRAAAELWRLASEWRVKPVKVLTGHLWELP